MQGGGPVSSTRDVAGHRVAGAPRDPLPGHVVDGKYELVRRLGAGGMGVVYEAVHLGLDRRFAVKLLRAVLTGTAVGRARFQREAAAMGRLRHPHIVQVTDFGLDQAADEAPYLVMERLQGETLAERQRGSGRLPLPEALALLRAVAAAVDHAHANGVLHRDLKPHNMMLCADDAGAPTIKILDFGLAQLVQAEPEAADGLSGAGSPGASAGGRDAGTLTCSGALIGTPCYAAPEVIGSGHGQAASDIYSLGVVAYELLVGRPPFLGTAAEVIAGHLEGEPPDPASLGTPLPAPVVQALRAPLHKDPARRPRTASEAVQALAAAHRGLEERAARTRRRGRRAAATAMAAALAVGLSTLLGSRPGLRAVEARAGNLRLALVPPQAPDPRLAVVLLDEASLRADPRPLGDQADTFAAGLEALYTAGARAVAVDLLLPEAWSASEAFSSFVLRHRDTLTLAAFSSAQGQVVGPECLGPLTTAALGEAGVSSLFGFANLEEDEDGVVRSAALQYRDESGHARPSWAAHAARALSLPAAGLQRVSIDYRANEGRLAQLSWIDVPRVLRQEPGLLRGRLVLVGASFVGSGDDHLVPGRAGARSLPGVLVHALIVNTLAGGVRLREAPGLAVAAAVVLALVTAYGTLRLRRPWAPPGVLLLGAVGFLAAAVVVWRSSGLVVAWVAPLLSGVVALLVAVPLRRWVGTKPAGAVRP
jgi:CHASE2 domain-containing sensor protein